MIASYCYDTYFLVGKFLSELYHDIYIFNSKINNNIDWELLLIFNSPQARL